jgi:parallel beta-helix repeat protein
MMRKLSREKGRCPHHYYHTALVMALLVALTVGIPHVWIKSTSAVDSVTWTVGTWTESSENPIFAGVSRAYYPCVLHIGETYHMWYTDGGYQTGYANSSDGVSWGSPIIVSGLYGHPGHAVVVNIGTETEPYYRIWYANELVWPDNVNVIRTAESADGINWINEQPIGQINNVIQENDPSEPTYKWMFGSYGPEAVLHNPDGYQTLNETDPMGNKYVMYYDQYARTGLTEGINEFPMLAISVDGISWKRFTDEPLILPSGGTTEWDANYISAWSVLKRDDGYHMWYSGGILDRNDGIGYATSADGLNWTRCTENPLLCVDDGVPWRNDRTYCPCVIEDGGVFKMWFAGKDTATESYRLGYATIPAPLPDFYGIQYAIDTVDSGDVLVVSAGTYNERITIEKPLTLRGATANVNKNGYTVPTNYVWDSSVETIINNPTPELTATISVVTIKDTSDVTFEGFIVQSLNAPLGSANDMLLYIDVKSGTMENITIRNNVIGPNTNVADQDGTAGRMGLDISVNQYREIPYGLVNSSIAGNKIFNCEGNGNNIFIWGAYYSYGARHPSPMEGTVIEDNEITGSHRTGIEIAGGCSGLTIQNNIISNNKRLPTDDPLKLKYGNGIVLIRGASDSKYSTGLGPESLTIVGNDIFGNEKNGIYMGPVSKNHNITGNNIYDNGWDGIRLDMEAHYYNPDFETVDRTALFNATENIITTYNNIYDNSELGVNVIGEPTNGFVLNATLNWWGAASGPDDDAEIINGDGDKISERVVADPWIHDAYGLSMEEIVEPDGERYGSAPKLSNFGFDAAIHNLKSGWYRLDSGTWNVLFADVNVPEWNSDNWQVPDFAGLTEGNHTVFFKVDDVFGHESDVWSWQFCKDKASPTISNSQVNPDSGTPGTEFTITTDVEDPAGIQSVRASIQKPDETEVASVELTSGSSYTGIWNSTGVSEGTYYVDITATDKTGNSIEEENAIHFPILAMPVINWTCKCVPANQTGYEFDAKNETDTGVLIDTTTGTPTVTVACCKPENATGFACDVNKYIDVQLDDPTGVTSLEIKIYYTQAEVEGLVEAALRLYWWNGTVWKMCSNTGVNTTDCDCYSGYIWAKITADTEPSLLDLTGTPFGANSMEYPVGGTFGHTSKAHLLEKLAERFLVEHWLIVVAFGMMMLGVSLIVHQRKQSSPSF